MNTVAEPVSMLDSDGCFASDLFEEFAGGLGPDDWLGLGVVLIQVVP